MAGRWGRFTHFLNRPNRGAKGSGSALLASPMRCKADPWVADPVAAHLMNRANPSNAPDTIAALMRPSYPFVQVVDGPGDGGVDVVAGRVGRTVLIQVKHWAKPLRPCHVRDVLEKIQANYLVGTDVQVWVVNKSGFSFPESRFDWGVPVKLWKTGDLILALAPSELVRRIERRRPPRMLAMRRAGRGA